MQQRKSGRPLGTDGSDYSFRMVVDSRYKKVAIGKSRLAKLLSTQAVLQLVHILFVRFPILKGKDPSTLAITFSAFGLISLLIAELGRRHSRASFLRVCAVISSMVILLSLVSAISSGSTLEVILNPSNWVTKKFELAETSLLLLKLLVQIYTISTVFSLIGNMCPPKKAS